MSNFTFNCDGSFFVNSPVTSNPNGDRGLQIVAVVGNLGDDGNRASVALRAVSEANSDDAQELFRFDGLASGNTYALVMYPGIAPLGASEGFSQFANCVLPAKFQLTAQNDMGNQMTIDVAVSTLA